MTMDDRQLTERLESAYRIELTDDIRHRQLSAISSALEAPPVVVDAAPPASMRLRRRFAAIVAAITVLSPAAVAVAAEGSLPGDTLYPVKQVTEDLRSMVDPTIAARHRLEEADRMHEAGFPPAIVRDVLSEADDAITVAGDPPDLRIRWMDARDRMDVSHGTDGIAGTPPDEGGQITPPAQGGVTGHDGDRMVDDTRNGDSGPVDDSNPGHDTTATTVPHGEAGHDGIPPGTVSDSGTSDMGAVGTDSGTMKSDSGMSGTRRSEQNQVGTQDPESITSSDSSSMDANQGGDSMNGSRGGSGG